MAKEKPLLSSVNLQDNYDCMAGVNNSHTIFGPQGPLGAVTPKTDDALEPQDWVWEEKPTGTNVLKGHGHAR